MIIWKWSPRKMMSICKWSPLNKWLHTFSNYAHLSLSVHTVETCSFDKTSRQFYLATGRGAIPSYQRRLSSPRKREESVRFPKNLHGVRRSARPTSTWAPKAHRMMGKTQWRLCRRSFGTNVLGLGNERDDFLLLSKPLKRTSTKVSL